MSKELKGALNFGVVCFIRLSLVVLVALSTFTSRVATANPLWDEVKEDISLAAYLTDYPAETLAAVAYIESSFRKGVQSKGSSASGLNQITKATWNYLLEKYGPDYNLPADTSPFDPRANSILAAMYLTEIGDIMSHRLKREVTPLESYLGYKFSPYRAVKMLRAKPSTPLLTFYPAAAKRNHAVYYKENGELRTIQDVKDMFESRMNYAISLFGDEAIAGVVELREFEFIPFRYAMEQGLIECVAEEEPEEPYTLANLRIIDESLNVPRSDMMSWNLSPSSGRTFNGFFI